MKSYIRSLSCFIAFGVFLSAVPVRAEDPNPPPTGVAGEFRGGDLQAPVIRKPEELEQILGLDAIGVIWAGVPDALSYHYVLAKDRSFKEVLIDGMVSDVTSVALQPVDYGTYFLKVSAVAMGGREGPFSEKVSFIVVPDPRPEGFSR